MKINKSAAESQFSNWRLSLCSACLSQNRILTKLSNLREIYEILCKSINLENYADVYLCWECLSLLRKVHKFRENVRKSQDLLIPFSSNTPGQSISFSNLITSEILTLDTFETPPESKTLIANETPDAVKEIQDEKEEDIENMHEEFIEEYGEKDIETILEGQSIFKDTENDDPDYIDEITDSKPDIVTKSERKPKSRNYPNERCQQYIMMYHSLKWKDAVQKLKINNEQLKEWLEKERNSEHFQNLKNKCFVCVQKLKIDEDIQSHEAECHTAAPSRPYSCDICRAHFPSKHALGAHIRKHYFIRACNICGYQCYSPLHMRHHLKRAHTRNVVCVQCGESFNNTREFYVHLRSHSTRSYCYCDQCGRKCASLQFLEKHIKRKHEAQRCEVCDMTFKNHIQLSNHMKLKHTHAPSEQSFCAPCNIQFDNVYGYKRHLLSAAIHLREKGDIPKKEVACPVCLKVYSKNQNMMNHYRWVHTRDSRYKCEHCGKSFLNRTRYKDHVLYEHLGRERPRDKICQFCNKAFTSNQALQHHVLIHTGEQPHACPYPLCTRRFRQRYAMRAHVRHVHLHLEKRKKDEGVYVVVPYDSVSTDGEMQPVA